MFNRHRRHYAANVSNATRSGWGLTDEKFNFSKPITFPALSFVQNHFLAGFLTDVLFLWIAKPDH
jgi:hypothetical protein